LISIIVPTLGRPQALAPLIYSIRTTTPRDHYEIVFVLDHGDIKSHQALRSFQHDIRVVSASGTYPQKINHGYDESVGDLILPTADDVRFHSDWYELTVEEFGTNWVCVLGTNDLSPATEDGEHVTMPIVRRSYIEDPGAVLGERGSVFNEAYHHNFVETELWQLARYRKVTRWSKEIVIEHLHPDWGKREEDATDQKGMRSNFDEDAALFYERAAAWT
jgi:glycosyltransferase involved in cell wall biosynthesis